MTSNFALRSGLGFFFATVAFAYLIVGANPSTICPTFYSLALSASMLVSLLADLAVGATAPERHWTRVKTALSHRQSVPRKERIQRNDPYII